jgi:outer membrane protein assembly factor BamA
MRKIARQMTNVFLALRLSALFGLFFIVTCCLFGHLVFGQTDTIPKHRIGSIQINGLRHTRSPIVQRELLFKVGDLRSQQEMKHQLIESKYLIQNTNLFAEINLKAEQDSLGEWQVRIELREKWMIYPLPKFNLLDRNFNEWWYTFNGDLDRIVYGIQVTHLNVSGRADPLTFRWYNGFNRTWSLSYVQPNIDEHMRNGISIGASFIDHRVLSYKTGFDNRLMQLQSNQPLRNTISASFTLRHRNLLYNRSFFTAQISRIHVSETVLDTSKNPSYLNSGSSTVWFPDISYSWQHLHVDNINFPLKGNAYGINITKRGVGWNGNLNMLSIDGYWKKYRPLPRDFFLRLQVAGLVKLPFEQPYYNQRALGYGDYMLSGLDRYVIDGVASLLVKSSISRKLFSIELPNPLQMRQLRRIPLQVYLRGFTHQGTSYLPQGELFKMNNRWLYTGGFGIDLISVYDVRFALDYSFNQFGENGLFLHIRNFF